MKPPCDPFEEDLRGLQPKPPRPELMRRIGQALETQPADTVTPWWRHGFVSWMTWAAAAALVGGVALFWMFNPTEPGESPSLPSSVRQTSEADASLRLVDQTQYLFDAKDEGIICLDNSVPFRKVRCQFIDAARWQNPQANFTVELSTPAEEVVLLPVNTY